MINDAGLTPAAVLGAVGDACLQKRVAENTQLIMATRWADIHPRESIDPHQLRIAGGDREIHPGGDGTPGLAAFAVPEFGTKLCKSIGATERYFGDALDLRHRFPKLWKRVCAFEIDGWQAQLIAQQTRHLTLEQALTIDQTIADQVGRSSRSQLRRQLDAKIIEVDAENIARQAAERRNQLGVWTGQGTEAGTKTVYARAEAPDVIWFDAMVDRIAVILARRGDKRSKDRRRAAALGILANPLYALRLLAEDAEPSLFDPVLEDDELASLSDAPVDRSEPAADPDPVVQDADGADHAQGTEDDHGRCRPVRFPRIDDDLATARAAIAAIGKLDPARLRPPATLYVHIAAETLSQGLGVTRVEEVGPIVSSLVGEWLKDCNIILKPVIDLRTELTPVDAYEIPRAMRERMFLRRPTSTFPFSAGRSRRVDLDHSNPYRDGLLNQTRESNLGPVTRREHNVVTRGDWNRRRAEPGTWLFRAPHGTVYLVNETGTHDLGNGTFASLIWHAATPGDATN